MSRVCRITNDAAALVAELSISNRYRIKQGIRRELRLLVTKELSIKQFEQTERELIASLTPMFEAQIDEIVRNLRRLGGKSFEEQAAVLAEQIFDPSEWNDDLFARMLPILAINMAKAGAAQLLNLGIDIRKSFRQTRKRTTASEWIESHPEDWEELQQAMRTSGVPIQAFTELPVWMKQSIASQLTQSFKQDYWKKINKTTQGDAERVLHQGLERGWSIRKMANEMKASLGGDRYAKIRATAIARTEGGSALNGARRAAIDQLSEELGPQLPIKASWLSVLSNTTRADHAFLDGTPADEQGLFNLAGHLIPWPSHFSLPPGQRINCLCTLTEEFGMDEAEALQIIQSNQEFAQQIAV